ncbi:poly [ADP-ribose] polymerase 1-like isoform X3 [Halichondria panicea]|uniref:poly [ADP-ribose] polymerase 1-like isoform X3 n=1 Tax=Halichondria panicea TaxID=6063 RepID=UPI00312B4FC2
MAEEEERPFRAEYAKSGRAGCKQCRGNISKDSLRLAKLVQSAFFDGKQTNWYHFGCFFKNATMKSVNEVSGFSSLRWDDQEKIKKKISGAAMDVPDGAAPSDKGKGKGKAAKRKTTRSDLQVEYAKSGRSNCKSCNSQIAKDEIRIAKMIQPDADQKKFGGLIPAWHHVDCFSDNLDDLDAVGVAADELSGFTKLKKEDKDELLLKLKPNSATKGKGKKRKLEDAQPPPVKKTKEELQDEKALKVQSEMIWKVRDQLKEQLGKTDLQLMLEDNNQKVPVGESNLLDRCASGMVFGALQPCSVCESGQLVARSHTYQCTGNMSAWTKCINTTDDPSRTKWIIPESLKEIPFLSKYKYKARKRVFSKDSTPSQSQSFTMDASMDTTDGPGPSQPSDSKKTVEVPLKGFTVIIIGRLSQSKPKLTQLIESLGGRVVSKVTDNTTICISSEAELEKMSSRMVEVEDSDVPVVSEDYLEEAGKGAALLKIPSHTISDWGAPRHSLPSSEYTDGGKSFKSQGPSKVKVMVKGGAAVDPDSELEGSHHVLEERGVVWNAVLGLVDVIRGTNSYYKLQLLEGDSSKNYYVFRSWGRVGTTIGGSKTESFGASKPAAKKHFELLYQDKTGNSWGTSKESFVKRPSKFYPLEIDYGGDEDTGQQLGIAPGSKSTLAPEIQDLIRMIFDVESMKKAMLEFEIDMKKMPLGKLSRRQIESAYSVLSELQREIVGTQNPSKILDCTNRFYTLVPHDFGMTKPPPLNSEEVIKIKTQMLDNLLEIEVAYSLLKQEDGVSGGKDPLDLHYEQLKTKMDVLPKGSDEFSMLQEYVSNTHAVTHSQYSLEVLEVFKVDREGEGKKYKLFSKLHNRQLLWHGSRKTNFVGILSQGLRIAPPEAPVTGYMFGKGVYFADMVSKSANYCSTSRSDNEGLMLLCEVALGDMFIVYDVSQIRIKYLLKMNFKYKW